MRERGFVRQLEDRRKAKMIREIMCGDENNLRALSLCLNIIKLQVYILLYFKRNSYHIVKIVILANLYLNLALKLIFN